MVVKCGAVTPPASELSRTGVGVGVRLVSREQPLHADKAKSTKISQGNVFMMSESSTLFTPLGLGVDSFEHARLLAFELRVTLPVLLAEIHRQL